MPTVTIYASTYGSVTPAASKLSLSYLQPCWDSVGGATTHIYLAFSGVPVPQSAPITAANLELYNIRYDPDLEGVITLCYGIDEGNHVPPNDYNSWVADCSIHTSASESFSLDSYFPENTWVGGNDLAAEIQEIVNRLDWSYGNTLGLHLESYMAQSGADYGVAYRSAARLTITYSTDSGSRVSGKPSVVSRVVVPQPTKKYGYAKTVSTVTTPSGIVLPNAGVSGRRSVSAIPLVTGIRRPNTWSAISRSVAFGTPAVRAYNYGTVGESGYKKDFELAHMSVYERALTDEEIGYLVTDLEIE